MQWLQAIVHKHAEWTEEVEEIVNLVIRGTSGFDEQYDLECILERH